VILDPDTREALERLSESRNQVLGWAAARAAARQESGYPSGFMPRSTAMRALMTMGMGAVGLRSLGRLRMALPAIRWGISAFLLLRSMRRKR
jgi:hypothetical protein